MKRGKKRCWKGCKPVPGKTPYSKGSCSCQMSDLRPGMIEFAKLDLGEKPPQAMPEGPVNKRWYPTLHVADLEKELPLDDEGTAMITYKVQRRSSEKVNGKEKHSATIEVRTIETPDRKKHDFADSRPRNDMGQYMANETGGADPNSMAAAYGNVEQEKIMRRRSLVQRMKALMGRPQEQPMI